MCNKQQASQATEESPSVLQKCKAAHHSVAPLVEQRGLFRLHTVQGRKMT